MRLIGILLCISLVCLTLGFTSHPESIAKDYSDATARIIGTAMVEEGAYKKLEYLCDSIGNRLSGSPQLEKAVEWGLAQMKADGLENVHAEPVKVPHWVRGEESAEMLSPAKRKLSILGLGGTVGTPAEGINAEVVAVKSYSELDSLGEKVKGKIVLYNFPMRSGPGVNAGQAYGEAVEFRANGPSQAAKRGAIAALVRSVTAKSLGTPHTGSLSYAEDAPKIPAAAVTVENAEMMQRLYNRGEKITVRLSLGAQTLPDADSANVIGEIKGREHPDEIVLICGHLDSWDVGTGAHDDGAGVAISMEAARILAKLNLRPRRTIRVVLFTNEENGLKGAKAYGEAHKKEFDKHVAAIEADAGGERPIGFFYSGKDRAFAVLEKIAPLLEGIDASRLTRGEGAGADISVVVKAGTPGLGLLPDQQHYFDYHHTESDTFDKIDSRHLSMNAAAMAIMAYVIADLPEPLPRD